MSSVTIHTLNVALETVTLLLGAFITFLAYRAYRRTGSRSLQYLTTGFGIVTFGAILAGTVHQLFDFPFEVGEIVETSLMAVGFAVIVYSLYVTE